VIFEWDATKAAHNFRKHGLTFEEAATAFLDALAITYPDPQHSGQEEREITIGHSSKGRVVFVAHCRRGNRTRIISARKATKSEHRQYEEGIDNQKY